MNDKASISEQDIELISASLDGQLDHQQQAAFKRRLLQEPELNAQYQAFKQLDQKLKTAVSDIDNTEIPAKLTAKMTGSSSGWARYLISAAAVGLITFNLWHFNDTSSSSAYADKQIAKVLDHSPSMAPISLNEQRQMIVLNSYLNNQNQWCRHYQWKDTNIQSEAVACQQDGQWHIRQQQSIEQIEQIQTASDTASTVETYLLQHGFTRLQSDQEQKRLKTNK